MTLKKLMSLKSDEVCAYIQQHIREKYGDKVENASQMYARNGYYYIKIGKLSAVKRRAALPEFFRSLKLEG